VHRHVLAQLVCLGRHTVTGLLCTTGRQFADWSADYRLYSRERCPPADLFAVVRRGVAARLPADAPFIAVLDDSLLRKTGRTIPDTAWRRDPLGPPFSVNFVWGQRVLSRRAGTPPSYRSTPTAWPACCPSTSSRPPPRGGPAK